MDWRGGWTGIQKARASAFGSFQESGKESLGQDYRWFLVYVTKKMLIRGHTIPVNSRIVRNPTAGGPREL